VHHTFMSQMSQKEPHQEKPTNISEQTNESKEVGDPSVEKKNPQTAPAPAAAAIEIKEIKAIKLWFKVTNLKENHHGVQYQDGLVTLKPGEKFARTGPMGCAGRLYYTDREHIADFYNFGVWLRIVEIPNDAQTVLDQCGRKWGADQLFLKERYSLYDPKTYEKFGLRMADNKHLLNWALIDGNIEFLEKWAKNEEPYNQLQWATQEYRLAALPVSSVAWWHGCLKSARPTTFDIRINDLYQDELVDHLQAILENKKKAGFVEWWGNSETVVEKLIQANKKRGLKWVLDNQLFPITLKAVRAALYSDTPIYYLDALMASGQAFEFPPDILHGFHLSTKPAILQWIASKGLEIAKDETNEKKLKEKELKEKELKEKEVQEKEVQEKEPPKNDDEETASYMRLGKNFIMGVLGGVLVAVTLYFRWSKKNPAQK
jgi:hypothetical protein